MNEKVQYKKIEILILTALMIAVVFIAGSIIKIPTLNGFIQVGDCMVLLSATLLGRKNGAIAAAIGMTFVDLFGGYFLWAPFTFIIKGLMALVVATIIEKSNKKEISTFIKAFIVGGTVDVLGYFIANAIMGGIVLGVSNGFIGSIFYASINLLGDIIQVIVGIVIAIPLGIPFYKLRKKITK